MSENTETFPDRQQVNDKAYVPVYFHEATQLGVLGAMIYSDIRNAVDYLTRTEGAKKINGHYWWYSSHARWQARYPMVGKSKLEGTLKKLADSGYIVRAQLKTGRQHNLYFYRIGKPVSHTPPENQEVVPPENQEVKAPPENSEYPVEEADSQSSSAVDGDDPLPPENRETNNNHNSNNNPSNNNSAASPRPSPVATGIDDLLEDLEMAGYFSSAKPEAVQEEKPEASTEPTAKSDKPDKGSAPRPSGKPDYSEEFEAVWLSYPRRKQLSGGTTRGSKKDAWQKWRRLSKRDKQDFKNWIPTFRKNNPDGTGYVANMATVINKRSWEGDEPEGVKSEADKDEERRRYMEAMYYYVVKDHDWPHAELGRPPAESVVDKYIETKLKPHQQEEARKNQRERTS